ncbi:MAG: hypothetical protein HYW05_04205 [Candidatus Diapherotrites archaeon]|nr:hypothetical protein [Candidatus Diapherotrites archaeon]
MKMKKTILIFGVALVLLLLLSGCVEQACNNNSTCDKGENVENCANDCKISNPPTPGSETAASSDAPPELPI